MAGEEGVVCYFFDFWCRGPDLNRHERNAHQILFVEDGTEGAP